MNHSCLSMFESWSFPSTKKDFYHCLLFQSSLFCLNVALIDFPEQIGLFGNASKMFHGFCFAVFIPSINLFFVGLCSLTFWMSQVTLHEPKLDVYFPKSQSSSFHALIIMKRAKSCDQSHLCLFV